MVIQLVRRYKGFRPILFTSNDAADSLVFVSNPFELLRALDVSIVFRVHV